MFQILSALVLFVTSSAIAHAAVISGNVTDENGLAIAGSTLCLSVQSADPAAEPVCIQTQTADSTGAYTFNQVQSGAYVVTIVDNRFPTFTWMPAARKLSIANFADQVTGFGFKKQFSFSNFQKAVTFSSKDLPELAGFNLSQETVFVKVYAVDPANPKQQTVFFMGRISKDAQLKFNASAPWAVKEVVYEIFSTSAARQGSLMI